MQYKLTLWPYGKVRSPTRECSILRVSPRARFGVALIGGARLPQSALRDDRNERADRQPTAYNVLGEALEACSMKPMTGFYRDDRCNTGPEDIGSHTVSAVMTAAFLDFSKSRGNDLSTPMPELGFPGLKPCDRRCLCAPR